MLVISRSPGESFSIGDNINVTILDVLDGKKIRIGISAPKDVSIIRDNAKVREPKPKSRGY